MFGICAFSIAPLLHHSNDARQLPVPSLAIMLVGAFKTRLFHLMQKIGFAEALDSIVTSDPRYQRDAYVFLRDALDFTTKQQKKVKGASVRHVTGPELLDGVATVRAQGIRADGHDGFR